MIKNLISKNVYSIISCITLNTFVITSCSESFLDVKPDQQMVVPSQMKDLRALLDNTVKMNTAMPYFGEVAADDQYITLNSYTTLSPEEAKLAYIWQSSPYYNNNSNTTWNYRYEQIFYCNLVLEAVEKNQPINKLEEKERDEIKGSALFFRAWAHWQLAQVFCKPYNINSSNNDIGLPLKLSSDINDKITRSDVLTTWRQILEDLHNCINLLPEKSESKTRPTLAAAYAFLSRVYLAMGDYEKSSDMASKCLNINDNLMDYAAINANKNYTMEKFNPEVLFHSVMISTAVIRETRLNVDSNLYDSYDENDYRKLCYFYENNGIRYKGSYNGDRDFFCGLTTSEALLNMAESEVRLGNVSTSVDLMDRLLSHRYSTNAYMGKFTGDQEGILKVILEERRKELVFRGIRWTDLRRLNQDTRFAITLSRKLDKDYSLAPNSAGYTFPIPQNIIDKSGIEQN